MIRTVNRSEITVGQRFREEMGGIDDLARSIEKNGLIQPLAVVETEKGYELLAGGRRMQATEKAGLEEIPVRVYPKDLSHEQRRSLELEENIQRKDLTWIEQCRLQREIHHLRTQLYGEREHSMQEDGWSLTDTAQLLQRDRSSVSKDIQLADAVDNFDDIDWSKCKNKHEATKKLGQLQEGMVRREMAKRAEQEITGDDSSESKDDPLRMFKQKMADSYVLMDALEGLQKLESEIATMVEIDPPYAIDLQEMKQGFKNDATSIYSTESYNEVKTDKYPSFLDQLLSEAYRVMKPDSWLVLWFGPEPWYQTIYDMLYKHGFTTTRLTGKWIKPTGQSMQPNYYLANACEEFFYAWKGRPILAKPGQTNVFNYAPVHPQRKTHPTERPIEMMQEIVETFTFENDQIVVPCCGSGNTIISSYLSKRKAFGYDLSNEYKENYILKVNEMF